MLCMEDRLIACTTVQVSAEEPTTKSCSSGQRHVAVTLRSTVGVHWGRESMKGRIVSLLVLGLSLTTVPALVFLGYAILFPTGITEWLGTGEYRTSGGQVPRPPKTVWDFIELLITPAAFGLGVPHPEPSGLGPPHRCAGAQALCSGTCCDEAV